MKRRSVEIGGVSYDLRDVPSRWTPSSWERSAGIDIDPACCRAAVAADRVGTHQCNRKVSKGVEWCKQHQPATAKARREAVEAKRRERDRRDRERWANALTFREIEGKLCATCRAEIAALVARRRAADPFAPPE